MSLTANELQEIERGQAAINRRRAEFAYMRNGSRKQPKQPKPPEITKPTLEARREYKCSEYPEKVTYYLSMGLRAARRYSGSGGAWRLYVLAKALDGHGREARGQIEAEQLRTFALDLGVNPRTYRRWYKRAISFGLLDPVQNKRGAWRLILPSAGKAAHYIGADDIGRKIEIEAGDLIGKGWKARINSGMAAQGLQISRERQQKKYNVPASTQRYRDNQAGVTRTANYAILDKKYTANCLPGLQEFSHHKGLFVANNGRIYTRKPDTRTTDITTDAGKSRGRKAKAELRNLQDQEHNGAFKMQRANGDDPGVDFSEFVRLFCRTSAQRKASERKIKNNLSVSEIYQAAYDNKTSGAGVWDVFGQM